MPKYEVHAYYSYEDDFTVEAKDYDEAYQQAEEKVFFDIKGEVEDGWAVPAIDIVEIEDA